VLSDATWYWRPVLAAYSATNAAWSFTNALRVDMRAKGIEVLGMHAGFIDTDLARGVDAKKADPREVAKATLNALENGEQEVLVEEHSRLVKLSLSTENGYYLDPPDFA
jgi:short-subunit dehydrogenase